MKNFLHHFLIIALVVVGTIAEAQEPKKVPRIGFLSGGSAFTDRSRVDAFRQGLKDLGYIEGKNIAVEYRFANGKVERAPDLAVELVHLNVSVIVAGGTPAALATQQATRVIPIVFATVADPLGTGLVGSLARPGGNVTGTTTINTDLAGKRLEVLKDAVPKISIVALIFNPADASNVLGLKQTESSAGALGLTLRTVGLRDPAEFEKGFSTITRDGIGAAIVAAGALTVTHRARIVDLAAKHRLPVMYGSIDFVEAGGLMSYAANFAERYHRAAVYVDKILRGAKPTDLPVEQPTKFELVINLKAAKQIGLTIPPNVLARADKVIR